MTKQKTTNERSGRGWIRRAAGLLSGGGAAYDHVASATDATPTFVGYRSACGWCYLGAPHSEAAHALKLAEQPEGDS
jgi:hypothetical protein